MATFEFRVSLPDDVANEATAAGLLAPEAITHLIEEAVRRESGKRLLDAMRRMRAANVPPLTQGEIATEVKTARETGR